MRISDWSSDVCSSDLDQRQRRGGEGQAAVLQQFVRHGEAEGDGLARPGLRRDEQVAPLGFGLDDLGLYGGQRFIAARDKGVREDGGKMIERHCSNIPRGAAKSEERRVGKECVRTCRIRGWPVK